MDDEQNPHKLYQLVFTIFVQMVNKHFCVGMLTQHNTASPFGGLGIHRMTEDFKGRATDSAKGLFLML